MQTNRKVEGAQHSDKKVGLKQSRLSSNGQVSPYPMLVIG